MISVVIPAYNEENSIATTLDCLSQQKTKYSFEVIVVNNNSTDNTESVVKRYSDKLNLRIIFEEKKGRGGARKRGFDMANGEIIASTDADTLTSDNWIESIGDYFVSHPDVVGITGICKYPDKKLSMKLFNIFLPVFFKIYKFSFGHYCMSGFSFAVKKEIYIASGGFNNAIDAQEDSELSGRIAKLGKIAYISSMTVVASDRRFNQGFLKGIWPYIKTFYKLKTNDIKGTALDDPR